MQVANRTFSFLLPFRFFPWIVALVFLTGCPIRQQSFRDTFNVNKANLGPDGGNKFFSLDVGRQLKFSEGNQRLTITVLDDTRVVDGVTTRVIEEREEEGGQPVEISRNFFAADKSTNDVYYFGEEVDEYKNGQLVSHSGAWLAGKNGARFGLMMPGDAAVGDRYYQEVAPGVAQDRAEHLSIIETVVTPAGTYQNCLHVKETTPIESDVSEKWYCPGVGLVRDNDAALTEIIAP